MKQGILDDLVKQSQNLALGVDSLNAPARTLEQLAEIGKKLSEKTSATDGAKGYIDL